MLHAKFHDHRTSGSGEKIFFLKVFTIYSRQPPEVNFFH